MDPHGIVGSVFLDSINDTVFNGHAPDGLLGRAHCRAILDHTIGAILIGN